MLDSVGAGRRGRFRRRYRGVWASGHGEEGAPDGSWLWIGLRDRLLRAEERSALDMQSPRASRRGRAARRLPVGVHLGALWQGIVAC